MKSFGVYYWYVKMPQWGCVQHGIEYIMFYVQKHIAYLSACPGPRWFETAARGTRICESRLLAKPLLK